MKKGLFSFRQILTLMIVAVALMITVSKVQAQFGSVDQIFNPTPAKAVSDALPSFVLQPDGKILTFNFAGTQIFDGVPKNQIARLNAGGTLDNSFNCAACDFNINIVLIQSDGKILVGGNVTGTGTPRLRRLNSDGSPDSSFVLSPQLFGSTSGIGAIQPDGKILLVTVSSFQGTFAYNIFRLNADGSRDTSFSIITLNNRLAISQLRLQSDGKIIISSNFNYAGTSSGFLSRYNTDGSRDTTFESPSLAGIKRDLSVRF